MSKNILQALGKIDAALGGQVDDASNVIDALDQISERSKELKNSIDNIDASTVQQMEQITTEVKAETLKAEGITLGRQNGVDVESDSPYYHANTKYYLEQAQDVYDQTVTVKNSIPTDYTALSDQVDNLKADLNDILENDLVNRLNDYAWVQGTISATTGDAGHSTTRIRTSYISPIKGVEANSGYKYIVYVYDSEKVFLGAFVNGEYIKGDAHWTTGKTLLSLIPDEYFLRLVMAKDDDSTVLSTENVDMTLLDFTDTSLTKSGKAADAKVVGDKITAIASLQKIKPYATVKGYMKTTGSIVTTGGLISKYINRGYDKIYLNGKSSLSNTYSILWFVKNGAMDTSVLNGALTMENYEVSVPNDVEELWFYYRSDENPLSFINVMSATDHIARQAIDKNADDISTANSNIAGFEAQIAGQISLGAQWNGKKWYAYGTSLTNINNEGKYATYLAQLSGMQLTNKGISGGGIGNLGAYARGQVYSAICNTTDGKLEADLITLETGANDVNDDVPLGTIYDTGTETLAGCLNDCIQYLLANTTAQIAIMPSPSGKNTSDKLFEWASMIKQICDINRVTYISPNDNIGKARANSSQAALYYVDNVHQTDLGGYVLAEYMWYQLRNIPLFHTTMPT